MAKKEKVPVKVQCPVCNEWMPADLGPSQTAVHIRKGSVTRCPGNRRTPKAVEYR